MSAPRNPPSPADGTTDNAILNSMDGTGEPDTPYVITDIYELQAMKDALDSHFVLGCDIDASDTCHWNQGDGFEPIGRSMFQNDQAFTGTFNGNGYEIQGLFINRPEDDNVGLFGVIRHESYIKSVAITEAKISGKHNVGAVVGFNDGGDVIDAYGEVAALGQHIVGGGVGWNNDGVVAETYMVGIAEGEASVGLVVGENWGQVVNVDSDGIAKGQDAVGRTVGCNDGIVAERE